MTLALNMPINLAVFRWDEEHGDRDGLASTAPAVGQDHTARALLDSAGFAFFGAAAVWH